MAKIVFIDTNKVYHKKFTHRARLSHVYSALMTPQFAANYGDSYNLLDNLATSVAVHDEYQIIFGKQEEKFIKYHKDNRLLFKVIKKFGLKYHQSWSNIFTIYFNGEPEVVEALKKLKQFACHVHRPSNLNVIKMLLENSNVDVRKQLPHGNMRYRVTIKKTLNWDHQQHIGETIVRVLETRDIKLPAKKLSFDKASRKKLIVDIKQKANMALNNQVLEQLVRGRSKEPFGYLDAFSFFLENEQELSFWLLMLGNVKMQITEIKLLSEIEKQNAEA